MERSPLFGDRGSANPRFLSFPTDPCRYAQEYMHCDAPKRVLVVDDEPAMRDYLHEVLRHEGYECLCFEGSLAALAHMAEAASPPDLLLTDINMPGMSGIELLRCVKTVSPDLPVILISGLYELSLAIDALKAGAADYLLKPATPQALAKLVNKHVHSNNSRQHAALRDALGQFLQSRDHYRCPAEQVGHIFDVLSLKRYETLQHSKRVAAYSLLLGGIARLSSADMEHLELGALLHDIGKVAIPHNVLMKPGPLTDEEWAVMKLHPRIGWELMSEFPES